MKLVVSASPSTRMPAPVDVNQNGWRMPNRPVLPLSLVTNGAGYCGEFLQRPRLVNQATLAVPVRVAQRDDQLLDAAPDHAVLPQLGGGLRGRHADDV